MSYSLPYDPVKVLDESLGRTEALFIELHPKGKLLLAVCFGSIFNFLNKGANEWTIKIYAIYGLSCPPTLLERVVLSFEGILLTSPV